MTSREEQVVALLRQRFDWLPGPRSCLSGVSEGGESASEWFVCPRCAGKRSMGAGKAEKPCDRCGGAGRVKGDPMTFGASKSKSAVERERVTGEAESALLRRRAADRQLRKLELAALHRAGKVAPGERESWERAKAALYRSGSFAELDEALAKLEKSSAYDRAALEVVYGYDSPLRTVGKLLQDRADLAVAFVADRMPGTIVVPERAPARVNGTGRWANGEAQQRRDREIWRLHTVDGLNREQIGRRLGIDRSTVSRVLAPKSEEAA